MEKPLAIDKIVAMYRLIKKHVTTIKLLLCENSHIHVLALKHGDIKTACAQTLADANDIKAALRSRLPETHIELWRDFVDQDTHYAYWHDKVYTLYHSDKTFRTYINDEAAHSYTHVRQAEYPDAQLFHQMARQDYLAHCIYTLIAIEHGFFYEFYLGALPKRIDYVMRYFLSTEEIQHTLQWINITLHTPKLISTEEETHYV
jgi:hypothetical protein